MAHRQQTGKKHTVSASCYDLALERLAYVFDRFDQVVLSFSGGKDSTAVLNVAVQMATEKHRLPLDVISFDEEAIPPETVEYLARVASWPTVRFHWFCLPVRLRNACSRSSPYWHPWDPDVRDRWVRPLPPTAITEFPGFVRAGIGEQISTLFSPTRGTVANLIGLRAQESLSRHHAVAVKRGFYAFMTETPAYTKVYPIYDWMTQDVWRAPAQFGWDYNRAYDVMEAAGLPRQEQRCSPAFGDQPIRRLHTYRTCWPELWAKMVDRVPGAATAARYANTELYAVDVKREDLPEGFTWRQWTMETLAALPPESRKEAAQGMHVCISIHNNRTGRAPIPDEEPHPISGFSWRILYLGAKTGANKFARIQQKMLNRAIAERRRRGITH